MRIWLLSSGSSGNAAIVEAAGGRLLIDAGIGPRVAATRMRQLGGDLFPRGVDAILVTHQHGDHIAHLEPLARAARAPIFLHAGITALRARRRFDTRTYVAGTAFEIGPFEILAESVPHDAPQVALRVSAGGVAFGLATDLGHVPPGLAPFLGTCDEALIEANYCPVMMHEGPYPPHLKQRVTGRFGHLANDQTASLARSLVRTRVHRLWLGHLSRVNNTPRLAHAAVTAAAPDLAIEVIHHGLPRLLEIEARSRGLLAGAQMPLPFTPCEPPARTP